MDKIELSQTEKRVFKAIDETLNTELLAGLDDYQIIAAAEALQKKGLVKCIINYESILAAKTTPKGKAYKKDNPNLTNPLSDNQKWKITQAISIAALVIAMISLVRTL